MLRFLAFLLVVLVVAVAVLLLARSRGAVRPEASGELRPPADPTARHTEAVAAAREDLQHAAAAHARALAGAEERLTEAGLDDPVVTLGGMELGRLTLVVDGRERSLRPETHFDAQVTGEIRWTVAEEEGLLRPRAMDDRRVRVVVEDPEWREEVELPGDEADEARRFVAVGKAAVRTLDAARLDRQRRITVALEELAAVRADTEELDGARMTLEDLTGAGPLRHDLPPPPDDDGGGGQA